MSIECPIDKCKKTLHEYGFWVGDEFKSPCDGPYCKVCAHFVAHIRGEAVQKMPLLDLQTERKF